VVAREVKVSLKAILDDETVEELKELGTRELKEL
jgi:hypothetical protein